MSVGRDFKSLEVSVTLSEKDTGVMIRKRLIRFYGAMTCVAQPTAIVRTHLKSDTTRYKLTEYLILLFPCP